MSTPATTDGLVVVHVRDQVNRTLAGHDGREYTSPPHHRTDALILVALPLGRPAQPEGDGDGDGDGDGQSSWSCPLAGGQRTITLNPVGGEPRPASEGPGDDWARSSHWPALTPIAPPVAARGADAPVPRPDT